MRFCIRPRVGLSRYSRPGNSLLGQAGRSRQVPGQVLGPAGPLVSTMPVPGPAPCAGTHIQTAGQPSPAVVLAAEGAKQPASSDERRPPEQSGPWAGPWSVSAGRPQHARMCMYGGQSGDPQGSLCTRWPSSGDRTRGYTRVPGGCLQKPTQVQCAGWSPPPRGT